MLFRSKKPKKHSKVTEKKSGNKLTEVSDIVALETAKTETSSSESVLTSGQEIVLNSEAGNEVEKTETKVENPKDSVNSEDKLVTAEQSPQKKPHKKRKRVLIGLLVVFVLLVGSIIAAVAYLLPPVTSIKESIDKIQLEGSALKQDLASKDFSKLVVRMTNVDTELLNIRQQITKFDFLNDIWFTKPYYKNIEVGKIILTDVDVLINKAKPKVEIFVNDLQAAITNREGVVDPSDDQNQETTNDPSKVTPAPAPVLSNAEKCVAQLKDNAELQALGVDPNKLADDKKNERAGGNTKIRDMISVLPEGIDIYNEIEPDLLTLIQDINKLDPDALPGVVPQKYTDALKSVLATTKDAETNFPKYTDLLKKVLTGLPDLLGSKKPVTYLIIFQNEKELRASGGLLTAYGTVTIDKGKVVGDIVTRDMWDLQIDAWAHIKTPYKNIYGQLKLMEDGCGAAELRSQDSGIYPDLQVSMNMFLTYYDGLVATMPNKYVKYDNVIILNTFFASDMVSLVEPLIMDDCQVITGANLAKTIFSERNAGSAGRKANIGEIAKAAESEFSSIPSEKISKVIDTLFSTIEAKNIAMFSKNPEMQSYFEDLGFTGRIVQDYPGDYFHLNEAQVCGLKANFYLYDKVTQNINIADDGKVTKSVNVFWQMDKVWQADEDEIMSNSPRFPYRAWIRVMAPQGTIFTKSDGLAKSRYIYNPVTYFDEVMGKQTSDNVIWFNHVRLTAQQAPPTYDLNVSYDLPSTIAYTDQDGYQMLVQKHPGKKDEKYVINLTYKGEQKTVEFALDRDKVVTFKNGELTVANYPHPLDDYSELLKGVLK